MGLRAPWRTSTVRCPGAEGPRPGGPSRRFLVGSAGPYCRSGATKDAFTLKAEVKKPREKEGN